MMTIELHCPIECADNELISKDWEKIRGVWICPNCTSKDKDNQFKMKMERVKSGLRKLANSPNAQTRDHAKRLLTLFE